MKAIVLFVVCAIPSLAGNVLVLKEEAQVQSEFIRLADIVDKSKSGASALAAIRNVFLGASPEEGKSRTISSVEIYEELAYREIRDLVIVGQRVTVVRASNDPEYLKALKDTARKKIMEVISAAGIERARLEISRWPAFPEGSKIESATLAAGKIPGAAGFELKMADGTKVLVGADVLAPVDVFVAIKDIRQGQLIDGDVLAPIEQFCSDPAAYPAAKDVHYRKAKKNIKKGMTITWDLLDRAMVVKRNEVVKVKGEFLETAGTATQDGGEGDVIIVKIADSGRPLRCRVEGPGLVKIVGGAK